MKKFLKFWGTRGSCPVSGPEYAHFGGNTCCLEIRYNDTLVIIDAGTGVRSLGATLREEKQIHLFLGHLHLDHLIGLPFFEPLYREGVEIHIWSPQAPGKTCQALINDLLSREFFPICLNETRAKLVFQVAHIGKPVTIGPLTLDFHLTHHPGVTHCFKIKTPHQTIGYVTDNEVRLGEQQSLIAFHKKCDLFIHEAQYTHEEYEEKKGWGHSPLSNVIALVNQIEPKKWLVTHHDPKHTDADLRALEALAKSEPLVCPVEWVPHLYVVELK